MQKIAGLSASSISWLELVAKLLAATPIDAPTRARERRRRAWGSRKEPYLEEERSFQSLKKSKSASLFTAPYLGSELSRRSTHSGDLKLRGVYFHLRRIWERG